MQGWVHEARTLFHLHKRAHRGYLFKDDNVHKFKYCIRSYIFFLPSFSALTFYGQINRHVDMFIGQLLKLQYHAGLQKFGR